MSRQEKIRDRYKLLVPRYTELVEEVRFALERSIADGQLKVAVIHGRVKTVESLLEKSKRKEYTDPLSEIMDLAGLRVVCRFSAEVEVVKQIILDQFSVIETQDKTDSLGTDQMGYQGSHYVVKLGPKNTGARYDDLADLCCEIQVRTILEDAWAQISHSLVYKSEASVPDTERRELNNVSSLLEVAQSIFDRTSKTQQQYLEQVTEKLGKTDFLQQPIDRETVAAYTRHRFPNLPINELVQELLIRDLDHERYKVLKDIDDVISAAEPDVSAYRAEAPDLFKAGTDFITKSLGFVDADFRKRHPFGTSTRQAFSRLASLHKRTGR